MGIAKFSAFFGKSFFLVFSSFLLNIVCASLSLFIRTCSLPRLHCPFLPPTPPPRLCSMQHILGGTPIRYAPSEKKAPENLLFSLFLGRTQRGKKYVGLLPLLAKMRGGLLHEETIYTTHTVQSSKGEKYPQE